MVYFSLNSLFCKLEDPEYQGSSSELCSVLKILRAMDISQVFIYIISIGYDLKAKPKIF